MQIKDLKAICAKSETKNRNTAIAIDSKIYWSFNPLVHRVDWKVTYT